MPSKNNKDNALKLAYALGLARISLGFIFLWAFFDKLLGLGFSTCRNTDTGVIDTMCDAAWLSGGSPTSGFLTFGTGGPFQEFYSTMAGNTFVDWLFMMGLLLIGLALMLGIGVKVATVTGSLLMLMMWTAALPPANNPFVDDHIVYIFTLAAIHFGNNNQKLGFGSWWATHPLVKKYPILR